MTEEEWLTSTDPAAMLQIVSGGVGTLKSCQASDRKLRLFAVAVARHGGCGTWANVGHLLCAAYAMAEGRPHGLTARDLADAQMYAASWLVTEYADECVRYILDHYGPDVEDRETGPAQAALLRDIIGNPFRPVTYPCCEGVRRVERIPGDARTLTGGVCPVHGTTYFLRGGGWLTPTVLTLAQAAYEERERACPACHGTGNGYHVRDDYVNRPAKDFCPPCGGTGRIDGGTLDPTRLAVLADALEEAGCPLYVHAKIACDVCDGVGVHPAFEFNPPLSKPVKVKERCKACDGDGAFLVDHPQPVLTHLRSPGPHVRGCWVVDLILGKE